jgi:hypothetical protein
VKPTQRVVLVTAILLALLSPISPAEAIGTGNCTSTTTGTLVATVTQSGSTCLVTFTFGTGTWTLPAGTYSVSYLVVGGGGSSSRGECGIWWGSGGGGGEVLTGSRNVTGANTVTVGEGGAGGNTSCTGGPNGNPGFASVLSSLTARAGGAGGGKGTGGASGNGFAGSTGPGGVSGCTSPGFCGAGGGGGASAAAAAGTMNAGAGVNSSLSGTLTHYGAGGPGRDNTVWGTANACAGGSVRFNGLANSGCGGSDAGSASGAGGSGIVIASYSFDITAPTFPSAETFNTPENSTSVASITTSESATITIFGGEDQGKFTISRLTDSSTALSFTSAPDFEAPTDVGANNTYIVVFRAVDAFSNAGYETVTVTVTDVVDTSGFNSFALAGNATAASYRTNIQITANVTVSARVTFRVNNIRIPGCINVRTTGSSPSIVAVCNWKPSRRGPLTLTATAVPTGAGITNASATPIRVLIGNRVGSRSQ